MAREAASDVSEDLEQLRRRFEEFRNTQPARAKSNSDVLKLFSQKRASAESLITSKTGFGVK
jgi:hypothetical protein